MSDEPEEGFTIRDRRRFTSDASETAPAPTPEPPAPVAAFAEEIAASADDFDTEEMTDAEYAEALGMGAESSQLPDIYSVLALFLGELRNLAWLRMGLLANPATGEIERDLPQAKIAIDTVGFLAAQLEPAVAPEERLPLKAMVSDLQINFVEQSKRS
jgi:hypothetical protein